MFKDISRTCSAKNIKNLEFSKQRESEKEIKKYIKPVREVFMREKVNISPLLFLGMQNTQLLAKWESSEGGIVTEKNAVDKSIISGPISRLTIIVYT